MRIVGVIPARWGSSRFPGKSLAPICGKPLIQWVVEGVAKSERLDSFVVATDDKRIFKMVKRLDVEVVMTRSDHVSGTDRVAEAVEGMGADIVVNIQGDEPLIDAGLIDGLVDVMTDEHRLERCCFDMATAVAPINDVKELNDPSVVKVVWNQDKEALYFSRSVIPFVRDGSFSGEIVHWRHIGIYAYRLSFLKKFVSTEPSILEKAECLEQLRALHIGARIGLIETNEKGIGVDTPDDVEYVEQLLRKRGE
ncbi:MAG: 3-deoxy-manno-octulosonate cytidylyltransferase [Kiritimatiellae bacterium]|nr:3-deoxy-manno-octulosonate cytidylyltransferase [Kiritimatiellia bacterium]